MLRIDPFQRADLPIIADFVAAIQEHERTTVPTLKTGEEIRSSYTNRIVERATARRGMILLARDGTDVVGFICAWIDQDSDPLLSDEARDHAYVSDLYVSPDARRRGVARRLLDAVAQDDGRARLPAHAHLLQGEQQICARLL